MTTTMTLASEMRRLMPLRIALNVAALTLCVILFDYIRFWAALLLPLPNIAVLLLVRRRLRAQGASAVDRS